MPCQVASPARGCVTWPLLSPHESSRPPKQAEAGPVRAATLGLGSREEARLAAQEMLVGLAGSEQQDMGRGEADRQASGYLCWPSCERE